MDKNKYSVEEPDNTDNSSMEGSDGELFVTRVSSSGVVLKFKAREWDISLIIKWFNT
jgi:hypothetical protein